MCYICIHHLWKCVPVIAVDLWRQVVDPENVVCTVGQDTRTIRSPGVTEGKDGEEKNQ